MLGIYLHTAVNHDYLKKSELISMYIFDLNVVVFLKKYLVHQIEIQSLARTNNVPHNKQSIQLHCDNCLYIG